MARKLGQHSLVIDDATYTSSISFSNRGEASGDWRLTAVVSTQSNVSSGSIHRNVEVAGLISKNEDNPASDRWVFFLEGNRQLELPGSFHSYRSLTEAIDGAAKLINQVVAIRWHRIDALHVQALVANKHQNAELILEETPAQLRAAVENDIVIRALRRREARRQAEADVTTIETVRALELAAETATATAGKERHLAQVEVISAQELGRRLQAGEQLTLANLGPITAHDVQGVLIAVEVDVRRWSPATGTPYQQRQLLSFHAADDIFLA